MSTLVKVTENNRLLRASANFGRNKQVSMNFYGGFTYLHLTNKISGFQVSLGMDELEQFLEIIFDQWYSVDQQFKREAVEDDRHATEAAAALEQQVEASSSTQSTLTLSERPDSPPLPPKKRAKKENNSPPSKKKRSILEIFSDSDLE